MIVTLLVLLYLGYQTYKGYKLGFSRRIINLIFAAIIFAAAILGQNNLGNWFYTQFSGSVVPTSGNTPLELMGYRFLAFFIIFFIGKMIVKIIKGWLPTKDPNKKGFGTLLDNVLGALISLVAAYFVVYVVLSMCNVFQNQWFIQQTIDSPILRAIIYNTPGLSNGVFKAVFGISRTLG
ncbi:CvpA family protein [uncultured Lactobacillus sp.]|uniref:CvpA family protein n=1 Tax=uncultured Lactobacillus sp. TaxID=153152 RepID=UPI00261080E9|nr:CvpA family protein [uncultured Lactobacillus sp.]